MPTRLAMMGFFFFFYIGFLTYFIIFHIGFLIYFILFFKQDGQNYVKSFSLLKVENYIDKTTKHVHE